MATGVAVRLISRHIQDKRADPAVVVVDDQGQYAISLLSGHLGGSNVLAHRVAAILGAQPVVTTASDGAGTISIDLLGQRFGWTIDPESEVTQVSAAMVNGEPVAVLQEAGEKDWWPGNKPLLSNVNMVTTWEELLDYPSALVISDRLVRPPVGPTRRVLYRPKSLVVGIGCNRGTSADEIELVVFSALIDAGLAWTSVRDLATVEQKRDEAGLSECAARHRWRLVYFTPDELNSIDNLPNPSPVAERELGARGVCEPAALLAAGATTLLVEKRKRGNVTVAIARVEGDSKHD
jgi:cobalt-precorrin 5A hydrolase